MMYSSLKLCTVQSEMWGHKSDVGGVNTLDVEYPMGSLVRSTKAEVAKGEIQSEVGTLLLKSKRALFLMI